MTIDPESSTHQPPRSSLRQADLAAGVGIVLFGIAALLAARNLAWDLASVSAAGWYTAPGIVPVAVSVILVFQGVLLAVHAFRHGGALGWDDVARIGTALRSHRSRRALLVALLLAVYIFGLVGRVQFTLASFVFLVVFMFLFRAGPWWRILLIAAVAAEGISFMFEGLARVPLP